MIEGKAKKGGIVEDFYRLLDIEEGLDSTQIEDYLRTLNREFRQRTNHRDAKIREEALEKLQQINRAMTSLGAEGDRASYDRELAGFRAEQELKQPLSDVDFYHLLQLSRTATAIEIQQALDEAEIRLGTSDPADEATVRQGKLIVLARHTLLDVERRHAYDVALQEKLVFAKQRDANKPVPLRVNSQEVEALSNLEQALEQHPELGFALLQDGEIEAWLRWSLNQQQRANWVHDLAENSKRSATPVMEYEEFLRLFNSARPFRLYAVGDGPSAKPLATIARVEDLPSICDQNWDNMVKQFDYLFDWLRLHGKPALLEKYASCPISEDTNIQLERLLFCIHPQLVPPELTIEGTDEGNIDFGTIQSWTYPIKRITIAQKGRGYLYGTITVSASWISVTPATFAGDATELTVTINAVNFKQGEPQQGQISLSMLDGRAKPVNIPVRVQQRSLFQSVKSLFGKG